MLRTRTFYCSDILWSKMSKVHLLQLKSGLKAEEQIQYDKIIEPFDISRESHLKVADV